MSITICPTCIQALHWSWEEAFDKFGFEDGDGIVMTEHVAAVIRQAGYTVTVEPWGVHNVTIAAITLKGRTQIPEGANLGYDDPRDYLPKRIVRLLDTAFTSDTEVEP